MAKQGALLATGRLPSDEAAAAEAKELDVPVELDGDPVDGGLTGGPTNRPENTHLSMISALSRMRTDWHSPDREILDQMKSGADALIQKAFGDLFDIYFALYTIVRTPEVNSDGEIKTDIFGVPVWKLMPGTNSYEEDWSRLGYRERETFLFKITTGIFRWSLLRDDMWSEAMFARAQFEEAFAHGYEDLKNEKATIEDRTARARKLSAEYRFNAVYASSVSRKADSVVRSAELLGQRLKDVATT